MLEQITSYERLLTQEGSKQKKKKGGKGKKSRKKNQKGLHKTGKRDRGEGREIVLLFQVGKKTQA